MIENIRKNLYEFILRDASTSERYRTEEIIERLSKNIKATPTQHQLSITLATCNINHGEFKLVNIVCSFERLRRYPRSAEVLKNGAYEKFIFSFSS